MKRMKAKGNALTTLGRCLVLAATFGAQSALAADADNGKRIAQAWCAPCHIVAPNQREELANSPPFDVIARKFGFNAEMLAYSILNPHPRMNMTLTRDEAEDIAAYMATLVK